MTIEMRDRNASPASVPTILEPGNQVSILKKITRNGVILTETEIVKVLSLRKITRSALRQPVAQDIEPSPATYVATALKMAEMHYEGNEINDHPEIGEFIGKSFRYTYGWRDMSAEELDPDLVG